MSWHMLLREDGHTRLTEKVTSEERPEAGEGVDQDGILASLKTESRKHKVPKFEAGDNLCGKHRKTGQGESRSKKG